MTLQTHWAINPNIDFLNHGCFGATPKVVLQAQRQLVDELECDPVEFLAPERKLESRLDDVRNRIAELVGTTSDSLVFVRNATDGVNAVMRSLPLQADDEILITDHGYNACNNAVRFAAESSGARTRVVKIPFPVHSDDGVVDCFRLALTPRTRLLVLDHVTSPTGLVFPIRRIVEMVKRQAVLVCVDGAHAPGMVPINLQELGADFYTANHHKWLCAPKASGFLYVSQSFRDEIRPTVISHGANRSRPGRSRFHTEFDWVGTYDPTPLLAVPTSLDFLASLYPGGLHDLMERNRELALAAQRLLAQALDIDRPTPESMIGSLVSIPLPDRLKARFGECDALQKYIRDEHKIEVPIFRWTDESWLLRVSLQAYNKIEQVERLADALRAISNP